MEETAPPSPDLPVVRGELLPDADFSRLYRMAKALAAGKMFRDVTQAEHAFSKMLVGYYLGLNPSQSMMGIHIVRGNVQMSYPTMGAFVKSRPGYDYKIREHDDQHAVIEFFKDDESLGTATFSVDDAKRAKLIKSDGGWETYPENMCVARALSKGIRFFMPEALGGIPVYTTGEIPPAEELSAGSGSGESRGVELPPEVLAVVERAESLGFPAWADVPNWEYALDQEQKAPGTVAARILEATADLDAREAQREAEMTDVDVVPDDDPDLPVEDSDLPEPPPLESEGVGGGEARDADQGDPAVQVDEERTEKSLKDAVRLKDVVAREPKGAAQTKARQDEIDYLSEELRAGGWASETIEALIAEADPNQETLL